MAGGRPSNGWTSSRKRQLVRLYTLTRLTKKEIQKVFSEEGFKTCERDIGKQLKQLLPKEYTTDHRAFRPTKYANDTNMRLRFSRLRHYKNGQLRRLARTRSKRSTSGRTNKMPGPFEGLPAAFLNYSNNPSPELTIYLSSVSSPESQPINSAQLMLDGSSLALRKPFDDADQMHISGATDSKTEGSTSLSDGAIVKLQDIEYRCGWLESQPPRVPSNSSTSGNTPTVQQQTMKPNIPSRLEDVIELDAEVDNDDEEGTRLVNKDLSVREALAAIRKAVSGPNQLASAIPTSRPQSIKSVSLSSLKSLTRRLSNRSSSYLHSVIRFSYSTSSGTSISWRSSWISSTTESGKQSQSSNGSGSGGDRLTEDEEAIWNGVIDESHVSNTFTLKGRPAYSYIAPLNRACCSIVEIGLGAPPCNNCGSSWVHVRARQDDIYWQVESRLSGQIWVLGINERDYFGNTPLHHAAASGHTTLSSIVRAISDGADVFAKNSSSQTFMYFLNISKYVGPRETGGPADYLELLRILENVNFPFAEPDCHGRTIAHMHLGDARLLAICTQVELSEVVRILKTDLDTLDNFGYAVGKNIESWRKNLLFLQLDPSRNRPNPTISFRREIDSNAWQAEAWPETLRRAGLITWIDIHGDTPLTAIIKKWKSDDQELNLSDVVQELIDRGVNVNMRGRSGLTALGIATIRGSRACVATLLDAGANPNARDYRGLGIIHTASTRMERASKQGKDRCYARILSCINLLADRGAKAEPTEVQEFLDPSRKESIEMRGNLSFL